MVLLSRSGCNHSLQQCRLRRSAQHIGSASGTASVTAELPAMAIAVLAVECIGRKLPMTALMAASAAAIAGLTAVASTALIAVARCCISAAFTVLYVYTPEVCFAQSPHAPAVNAL